MKTPAQSKFPRASGVLLHPTALPGPFGIGDLGDEAYHFVDFLAAAGQSYWQVLPLNPTDPAYSPYAGLSAFAGNPLLVSPQKLVEAGHLAPDDLPPFPASEGEGLDRVEFEMTIPYKTALLDRAFAHFCDHAPAEQRAAFERFCAEHASWLDDFALFVALREAHDGQAWYEWEPGLVRRRPAALTRWRRRLAYEIERHKYRQWQFCEQWLALKRYANARGVRIIGDIPIFVAMDSADVWTNLHLFHLDRHLHPTVVSGVPPDYFSPTGQLWGHPLYRWDAMAEEGYAWWIARFRMAFTLADVVRVDHFRGFYNYWEVPADEETALNGRWAPGPGAAFFRTVTDALGDLAIIAEDLGDIDEEARAAISALQAEFDYPGMKVLQFAFGTRADNEHLPHNFVHNRVVYTGTHDNDTVAGWYRTAPEHVRDHVRRYLACDGHDIAWDVIRLAWASVAHTAITTAQDLLSLGSEARFNLPGSTGGSNWRWRLLPGALNEGIAARLADMTALYGRNLK